MVDECLLQGMQRAVRRQALDRGGATRSLVSTPLTISDSASFSGTGVTSVIGRAARVCAICTSGWLTYCALRIALTVPQSAGFTASICPRCGGSTRLFAYEPKGRGKRAFAPGRHIFVTDAAGTPRALGPTYAWALQPQVEAW